jgi:hypothetical protein
MSALHVPPRVTAAPARTTSFDSSMLAAVMRTTAIDSPI